ncbi:MAG: hypothetical protein B7X09_00945 [Acidiphilium sp. 21-66-27]|nr:MAG: hypothetical protein B7Z76_14915 [Acidiphilium sp. 20-67-58]OYV67605.1 MAG: hypothetical protein B7X09_00945 [Acidiphilium sp. 21-66-27]
MQRQPFGLSASHHQDAPRQHRHRAPGVGWIVASAQLTGISCGTAAAGSPSAITAARSVASCAASFGSPGQHAEHIHPSGLTTSIIGPDAAQQWEQEAEFMPLFSSILTAFSLP